MVMGYLLLITSMLLYVATVGTLLPRMLLRPQYTVANLDARGLRRCLYNGRRCVVYERCVNQRRYLSRYLLCEGEGCKILRCQVTASVRSMVYDVVLFDCYDRIFDIVHVKEDFTSAYSKPLALPDNTSYVTIRLRKVNKTPLEIIPIASLPRINVILFALCTLVLTAVESVVIMTSCAYAFGSSLDDALLNTPENMLIVVVATAIAALVGLMVASVAACHRMKV